MSKRDLKVVVGLGKTGLSCVHHLQSRGFNVAVTDTRLEPPGLKELETKYPKLRVELGSLNETLLTEASELIVSPGLSIKEPLIAKQLRRGIPIIGDIELFARSANKPTAAITGSNGKSTVTSIVGYLAECADKKVRVGGNLGTPALDLLDNEAELYVLELSSFQLETTYTLNTLSSVNLNISADHMDRYESLNEYVDAKLRIYNHCQLPVVNLDDPISYQSYRFKQPPLGFTLGEPSQGVYGLKTVNEEKFLAWGETKLLPVKSLSLRGQHQYANVLAALAIGSQIGLPLEVMIAHIINFKGLPHRCQLVANIEGVDWYNDSKATNVGSAQAAILGIGPEIAGKIVLLAGGQGKKADFSDLYQPIAKFVKELILFGEDKSIISKTLKGASPIKLTDNLESAVDLAKASAIKGDVVLLSPACASLDMFNNFEHRGEEFTKLVRRFTA